MRAILLVFFLGISYFYGQLVFNEHYVAKLAVTTMQEAARVVKGIVPPKEVSFCTNAQAVASAPLEETTQVPHVWMWQ
jgi:hypothetical protein